MNKYKSIREVIKKGAWQINGMVFLIMISTLMGSLYMSTLFPKGYQGLIMISGLFLMIAFPWLWWSYKITQWRIWAFENTRKEDWEELMREAVNAQLIWREGSIFEKTEIRTASQQAQIAAFYAEMEQMRLEMEGKEHTVDDVEDDSSIPEQTIFYYDKKEILAEFIGFLFIGGLGTYFLYESNFVLGIILLVASLFTMNFRMLMNINNKDVQLILNEEGIDMKFKRWDSIKWADTQDILVNTNDGHLTFVAWKEEESFSINFPLKYLTVKDYKEFVRMVNVYKKRYFASNKSQLS